MGNINEFIRGNEKGKEEAVSYLIESQKLLLKISQDFTNVESENIDDLINRTLRKIVNFNEDECCRVFLYSEDGSKLMNTHTWCSDKIQDSISRLDDLTDDLVPWWMENVRNNETIHISRTSELPPEAHVERDGLLAKGIRSLLVVPIIFENNPFGYMGFESVSAEKIWSEESLSLLKIISNILANALHRKKYLMALRKSENYYYTLFENTGAATCIMEEDMTICRANREWKRIFGYENEELEGSMWIDFFAENDRKRIMEYYDLRKTDLDRESQKFATHIKNKAGKIKDCLITIDSVPGTSKTIATHSDITELNRINRAFKAISEVNTAILQAENEFSLLEEVCHKIIDVGGYYFTWIGYVSNDEVETVVPMAYAGHEERYLDFVNVSLLDSKMPHGLIDIAIRNHQVMLCRDIEKDTEFILWKEEAKKRGYKSVIAIPMDIYGKSSMGVLVIYSDRVNVFDKEEGELLMEMAENLAYGINTLRTRLERDRYAQDLKQSIENMKQLFYQIIESLEMVMKIRDPYTAKHQQNVAKLATAIAEEMNLTEEQKTAVLIAASLHDIGKLNIPSDILNKPGEISKLEFGIIQSHCQTGYDVVKNINFPWVIEDIILQHHERMDGSGYPQGLKGVEINLLAGIIGVADVVEAMTSHRPYRPARGMDRALQEIKREKGIKYDSDVVDACLNLFQQKGFVLSE